MSTRVRVPNALRTQQLDVADGSLAHPSLRFRREPKTGVYRNGAGRLALAVGAFRSVEVTATDTFVRSNGTGSVSPLAFGRANATSANDQETRLDAYELATVIGRIAAWRQSATQNGWKLYGSTGGVLNAADLTISADGNLQARGSLNGASLNVGSGALTAGAMTGRTLMLTGVDPTLNLQAGPGSNTGNGTFAFIYNGSLTAWAGVVLQVGSVSAFIGQQAAAGTVFGGVSGGAGDLTISLGGANSIWFAINNVMRMKLDGVTGIVTIPGTLLVNGTLIAKSPVAAVGTANFLLTTTATNVPSASITLGVGVWKVDADVVFFSSGAGDIGWTCAADFSGASVLAAGTPFFTMTGAGQYMPVSLGGHVIVAGGTATVTLRVYKNGGSGSSVAALSAIRASFLGNP